jgi:Flp pilus assembly protein TadG
MGRSSGAAAVEMALVASMMMPIFAGIWDVGRIVEVQQVLTNAAREGARQASTSVMTASQCQTVVTNYITVSGVNAANAVITVFDLTNPGTDPSLATQNDCLYVSVSIPFSNVRLIVLSAYTRPMNLSATATWFSMSDLSITVNTSIPQD